MEEMAKHGRLGLAAARAGMDRKTARKYVKEGKFPSELKQERTWRTRDDPFEEQWESLAERLKEAPELEAKTLFEELCAREPGRYKPGQLRTLQRRRLQDANHKNPIRFSLHRRVFRLSRRPSASRVANPPGDPSPHRQRPSGEVDGQACLESEVEGASSPRRRGAAEQGRQAAAGGNPQRLVGKTDRPRGLAAQPAAKGRGGRPGGKP